MRGAEEFGKGLRVRRTIPREKVSACGLHRLSRFSGLGGATDDSKAFWDRFVQKAGGQASAKGQVIDLP